MTEPATCRHVPTLRRGVRLVHDDARAADLALLPEGVLVLNETASAVLALCDGVRAVEEILMLLGRRYARVRREDVVELLGRLADRRVVLYG